MAVGQKSMGTTLTIDSDLIADIDSIGEAGGESDELDTTTLDSPNGYREFVAGLKDGGEITFSGKTKTEANLEALWALFEAQTVVDVVITTPSGSTLAFSAFVKSFKEGESAVDSVRTFNGTLRVSGAFTYTPVAVSA